MDIAYEIQKHEIIHTKSTKKWEIPKGNENENKFHFVTRFILRISGWYLPFKFYKKKDEKKVFYRYILTENLVLKWVLFYIDITFSY